jgi:hypothetical protein
VLLCHGGLWARRDARTSLLALQGPNAGLETASATASLHVLFGATWWNSWMEQDLQPLWPETYALMSPWPAAQALMPGLRARARAELFEPAFDDVELNQARYERRRREAAVAAGRPCRL